MFKKLFPASFLLFGVLAFPVSANAQSLPTCTVTNGAVDVATLEADPSNSCWGEPDYYSIIVYEMGLCTSVPTVPTTTDSYAVTNCVPVFESAAGAAVVVQKGVAASLPGPFSRPPNGSYTHGYMILDKDFTIGASIEFDTALTGNDAGTGKFCRSSASDGKTTCDTVASSGYTNFVEAVNDLGSAGFSATASVTYAAGTLSAALIDTGGREATASGDVDRLFGMFAFSSAKSMTSQSISFDASVQITNGMTISTDGSQNLQNISAGPFSLKLSIN